MQTWACLLPMAFSQDSTSFQPSGLLAKILDCLRWPLAQLVSKVSLDTPIPTIESLTTCYHDRGWTQQGSAADHLVRGISGLPRPSIPSGINSGTRRSGAISRVRVLSPKGGNRLTAFLAVQRDIVTRRTSCNVQGRGHPYHANALPVAQAGRCLCLILTTICRKNGLRKVRKQERKSPQQREAVARARRGNQPRGHCLSDARQVTKHNRVCFYN
jgi:hypothetical protein